MISCSSETVIRLLPRPNVDSAVNLLQGLLIPETDGPRHRKLPSPTLDLLIPLSSRSPLSHASTLLVLRFPDRHVTRPELKEEGKGKGGTRR
jgi:hypothetical protein